MRLVRACPECFQDSVFTNHPVLKINAPKIRGGGNQLDPQVPAVGPLRSLPDDHGVRGTARGQIRQAKLLLQVNFRRAYQEAAVGIHNARIGGFEMHRTRPAIPFDAHGYARIHAGAAPPRPGTNVFWQVLR